MTNKKARKAIEKRITRLLESFESKQQIRSDINDWYSHYLQSVEYRELRQQAKDDSFFRYTELIEFFN